MSHETMIDITLLDGIVEKVEELGRELAEGIGYQEQPCGGIPHVLCPECGKDWFGWALKHKDCFCDCGTRLDKPC
jgi:hypothetical protein